MTTSTSPVTVDDLLANAAWTRRLALNLMSDRDQADDLVQETWIAALRAQPDQSQSLRPWLARVLRNRAANRSRDAARREARHDRAADLVEAAAAADPEELLSRMQVQRLLAEMITGLREPARQTVLLRFYEGLTSEQIGEAMGVAPGTVRRRLKEAVDELRDELDRRHQGNRDTWLLALLPLGATIEPDDRPPSTATTTTSQSPSPAAARRRELPAAGSPLSLPKPATSLLPKLAIGGAALALAAAALLLAWPSGQSQPPDSRGPTTAFGGDSPGAGNPWLAAALPLTLDQCRDTLAARRRDLASLETEYRRNEKPEDLYEQQTTPNPTARAALLPDLERALRGDAAAGRSFTLHCQTLACRMVAEERPGDNARTVGVWLGPLREDPILKERVFRFTYGVGRFGADPENPSVKHVVAFLRLKDPSGARVAGNDVPGLAAVASKPLPANLEACRVELDATQRRIAFLKASNDHALSLVERFDRSPPNPALTDTFSAVIARALQAGGVAAKAEVVCRSRVCRVSAPGATSGEWLGALHRDGDVQRHKLNYAFTPADGKVFYEVGDPERPDGIRLFVRVHFEIRKSPGMKACGTRSPEKGQLQVRFVIPDGESPQPGTDPRRITAHLSGPLVETPLGRCVQEELTQILESIPLPAGVKGATTSDRIEFPLVEPPMRPRR
jgi:RNA polymerase sigma factor (sigma-70 family)